MDEKNPANSSNEKKLKAIREDQAWCNALESILREIDASPTSSGTCRSGAIPFIEGAIKCLRIDAHCLETGQYPMDLPTNPGLVFT
jgi:hypothetical protein